MLYNKAIFKRCFNFRGKQAWRNILEIPRYFRLMRFLMKHGYDEYATWETFNWFTITMKEILTFYKERDSVPYVLDDDKLNFFSDELSDEYLMQNEKKWYAIIDEMLSLLDRMNEDVEDAERYAAKDRFFILFSRYFYKLWD